MQGSLVAPHMGPRRAAAVDTLRSAVKGAMNGAWALEAVRRGVALAKGGDPDGALDYYNKVRWFSRLALVSEA